MNAVTRWDPLTELDDLQPRLSILFGRSLFGRTENATKP